ncbi:MAG TPA: tripartite tricarboxylate transporter substrate-binding protein [bacterium]|nr:tripartite tricarboxylate transporter substrate-binding protein [bacterium]
MITTPGGLTVLEDVITARRGDAHTLVAFSPGLTLQMLMKRSRYSYADITPIAAVSTDYGALVVPVASKLVDLGAVMHALHRNSDEIRFGGGSGAGAMHHGMVAVTAAAAGIAPGAVHYAGSSGVAEAVSALLAGQVTVAALGATDVLDPLRSGSVRILAVLADRRLPGPFAGVPTAKEQGLDVTFPMWRGFYAPPGVPPGVVGF